MRCHKMTEREQSALLPGLQVFCHHLHGRRQHFAQAVRVKVHCLRRRSLDIRLQIQAGKWHAHRDNCQTKMSVRIIVR